MKTITLYTDGACSGNPGRGGWAAIAFDEDGSNIMQHGAGYRHTTNNRMEILAVAQGLEDLRQQMDSRRETDIKVTVFSDSQLVVNTMNLGWSKNSNRDLWRKLENATDLFESVDFVKVKGHSNDNKNNLVDEVAVSFSQKENAMNVDSVYESIHAPQTKEDTLFDDIDEEPEQMPDEPQIIEIRLKNANVKEIRTAEIELSNGAVVKVHGFRGGFEQYNCNRHEAAITVDVANRLSGWLNGGNL